MEWNCALAAQQQRTDMRVKTLALCVATAFLTRRQSN